MERKKPIHLTTLREALLYVFQRVNVPTDDLVSRVVIVGRDVEVFTRDKFKQPHILQTYLPLRWSLGYGIKLNLNGRVLHSLFYGEE